MSVKTTFLGNDGREWYHIEGTEYGTGYDLNSDYAIDGDTVLDIDGYPLIDGDSETIAARNSIAIYNAASSLGKIGGSKTSDAKKKSSAENGKKGGRPRKVDVYKASENNIVIVDDIMVMVKESDLDAQEEYIEQLEREKEKLIAMINEAKDIDYHYQAMGCGLEDRCITTDRYEAMQYGWEEAMESVARILQPEELKEGKGMKELKPCPFCGNIPEWFTVGNDYTKKKKTIIKCKQCTAQITVGAIRNNVAWTIDKCAEAWNKRIKMNTREEFEEVCDSLPVKITNNEKAVAQYIWTTQQEKIDELEAENQEMLEALIDAVQRFYDYEMSVDTDAPYEHRRAMKFYLKVIEKATGKTWEQIKAGEHE